MNKYLAIINIRTFTIIAIYVGATFVAMRFDLRFNYDLTLISIAIIFPLVFTIRAAFRRREKSLEYLSRMKSGLITVNYCFQNSGKITDEQKSEIKRVLIEVPKSVNAYLMKKQSEDKVIAMAKKVFEFIQLHRDEIGGGLSLKVFRFMKDVHQGIENLMAVNKHRTPISLRAYCLAFIYIFPFIYIPSFLHKINSDTPIYILYVVMAIKGFILISLYNVQDHMEHPFDQNGLDDIRLKDFELDL